MSTFLLSMGFPPFSDLCLSTLRNQKRLKALERVFFFSCNKNRSMLCLLFLWQTVQKVLYHTLSVNVFLIECYWWIKTLSNHIKLWFILIIFFWIYNLLGDLKIVSFHQNTLSKVFNMAVCVLTGQWIFILIWENRNQKISSFSTDTEIEEYFWLF